MANNEEEQEKKSAPSLKLSRRGFLRAAGIVGGTVVAAGMLKTRPAYAGEDFEGYPDRYGMLTDTTKCAGCRMCELACAKANNMPLPEFPAAAATVFEQRRRPSAKALTVVNRYTNPANGKQIFRKEQCMHCNEPACASACLVGAFKKTPEGPVLYNENVCIGCRYCMTACPYSMLGYTYNDPVTPAVKKCVLCYQRVVKQGGVPACAEACPTKATIFGKRSDLLKIAHERIRQSPGQYVDHVFGEFEAGGASWLYLSAVPFDKLGLPTDLGKTPYPEYTRDFLLAVPLVLTMWPPLLLGLNAFAKRRERVAEEEAKTHKKDEEVR